MFLLLLSIPLDLFHCLPLLVFSSAPGHSVCSGRAAWECPWTHMQPVVMDKEIQHLMQMTEQYINQDMQNPNKLLTSGFP